MMLICAELVNIRMFFRLYPRTNEYIRLQTLISTLHPKYTKIPQTHNAPVPKKIPENHSAQSVRPHPAKVTDPLKKILTYPYPYPNSATSNRATSTDYSYYQLNCSA